MNEGSSERTPSILLLIQTESTFCENEKLWKSDKNRFSPVAGIFIDFSLGSGNFRLKNFANLSSAALRCPGGNKKSFLGRCHRSFVRIFKKVASVANYFPLRPSTEDEETQLIVPVSSMSPSPVIKKINLLSSLKTIHLLFNYFSSSQPLLPLPLGC